ncbi:hypothetical protein SDC9_77457 [bioreactor metagenome]|uniref:Uncharacterized protein n=1 Tax=bioreactor metagenome TaxID=1076179 RepID=A0A644YY50_9ZZZZ
MDGEEAHHRGSHHADQIGREHGGVEACLQCVLQLQNRRAEYGGKGKQKRKTHSKPPVIPAQHTSGDGRARA